MVRAVWKTALQRGSSMPMSALLAGLGAKVVVLHDYQAEEDGEGGGEEPGTDDADGDPVRQTKDGVEIVRIAWRRPAMLNHPACLVVLIAVQVAVTDRPAHR